MTPVDHRRPRKPQRSHSAVGAAIVAAAAMVAVFAFILTRGSTSSPHSGDSLRLGSNSAAAAPAGPDAQVKTTNADRKAPASIAPDGAAKAAPKTARKTATKRVTTAPAPTVDTGPTSPGFKAGQWIAVLDKYPTDVGMDASMNAKAVAAKLNRIGIPAKAMLVDGQYPGLVDSSLLPITDTWMVYLGPGTSSKQMLNLCLDPRTQQVYTNPACPTYEPAG